MTTGMSGFRRSICGDDSGSMAIESAFAVPILLVMCLGGFEVSRVLARHAELQTAMSEATAISLAAPPSTQNHMDTIEDVITASTGLADEEVTLARKYRCGGAATRVDDDAACNPGDVISGFIEITMTETYSPIWTEFGVGSGIDLTLTRTVQIS